MKTVMPGVAPRMIAARSFVGKGAAGILLVGLILSSAQYVIGVDVAWTHNYVTGEHKDLLDTFHQGLANNEAPLQIAEHDVMAPQRVGKKVNPPNRWFKPTLLGREEDQITVWFCDDDLYFLAYNNQSGELNSLQGYDLLFTEPFYPLGFNETYKSLLGHYSTDPEVKPHDLLVHVPLGQEAMLDAIHSLSRFPGETPVLEAKLAWAKICIMIPESLRFHSVRNSYILQWDTQESRLPPDVTVHPHKWQMISRLVTKWERNGRRGWLLSKDAGNLLRDTGINSAEEALGVVDLLIRIRGDIDY